MGISSSFVYSYLKVILLQESFLLRTLIAILITLAKPWILDQKPLLGRKKLGEVSLPVRLDHSTRRDSKRTVASTNHQQIRKMARSEILQHQQLKEMTMRENIQMDFGWL